MQCTTFVLQNVNCKATLSNIKDVYISCLKGYKITRKRLSVTKEDLKYTTYSTSRRGRTNL